MDTNQRPKPLRLLELPTDLQHDIIRNMNFLAIFHLSTFRAFRRNAGKRRYWTELCLKLEKDSEKDCIDVLQNETRVERILLHNDAVASEHRAGDKLVVAHSVTDLAKKIKGKHEDPREHVLRHLLQVFHFKTKKLDCKRDINEQKDSFVWNSIPMFDMVYLSGGSFWSSDHINMASEEIEIFLRRIKSDYYGIAVSVDDKSYKCRRAFGTQCLRLQHTTNWLEIDNILARENNLMNIDLCKLSDSQANSMLKQWIYGNCGDFLVMMLNAEHTFSEAETFKDIDLKAWEPSEEDEDPKLLGQTGKLACIRRKCDGESMELFEYPLLFN
ncbi:hypothetical protein B9Z55_023774 [Caenorhabditis nigoni]|uniref:F-box domain-containing protein n=1 Tax=Caenorhabditis nigoni TaxID=1611254 RepID=A0A2G5SRH1_9PELO|nr:hypothetical protein B9Z55_023774 [Caenorhabditis nigoni]